MTITSINHNPKNESKYARRRSVWKGNRNQLREALAQLHNTPGVTVYQDSEVLTFEQRWNIDMTLGRIPPKLLGTGKWVAHDPSQKILQATPSALRGDLHLLWLDFVSIFARRVGYSKSIYYNEREQMNQIKWGGHSVIVFAPGTNRFDLIVSKYGETEAARGHHFYQWQSSTGQPSGSVSLDNYETSEVG